MNLKDDKQQNIQIELDFSSALKGEAREAGREGTESSGATNGTESPASTSLIDRGSVSVTDSNRRVRTRTHGGVAGVGG